MKAGAHAQHRAEQAPLRPVPFCNWAGRPFFHQCNSIKGISMETMRERILNTIFEAERDGALLDVLYDAAHQLGTPDVFVEACTWLGYDPPEAELKPSGSQST